MAYTILKTWHKVLRPTGWEARIYVDIDGVTNEIVTSFDKNPDDKMIADKINIEVSRLELSKIMEANQPKSEIDQLKEMLESNNTTLASKDLEISALKKEIEILKATKI